MMFLHDLLKIEVGDIESKFVFMIMMIPSYHEDFSRIKRKGNTCQILYLKIKRF